jgi:hypothetical protein
VPRELAAEPERTAGAAFVGQPLPLGDEGAVDTECRTVAQMNLVNALAVSSSLHTGTHEAGRTG